MNVAARLVAIDETFPPEARTVIERLSAENLRLQDEITTLQDALGVSAPVFPLEWDLTRSEEKLLGVLLRRGIAPYDALTTALYQGRVGRDVQEVETLRVHILNLRRKLAVFGIAIRNVHAFGYMLTDETRERIRAAIAIIGEGSR